MTIPQKAIAHNKKTSAPLAVLLFSGKRSGLEAAKVGKAVFDGGTGRWGGGVGVAKPQFLERKTRFTRSDLKK
jgi:hypothetical protein